MQAVTEGGDLLTRIHELIWQGDYQQARDGLAVTERLLGATRGLLRLMPAPDHSGAPSGHKRAKAGQS